MIAFQIRPGPLYVPRKPVRDPKFLKYLRTLPCVGCGTMRKLRDAMHIGPHGLGQKASDLDALPGCRDCHRELHKIGPGAFQQVHNIEFDALQRMCRRFYVIKHGASDWWPNQPDLTLQACPRCEHEGFVEEMAISGCGKCGWRGQEAA